MLASVALPCSSRIADAEGVSMILGHSFPLGDTYFPASEARALADALWPVSLTPQCLNL